LRGKVPARGESGAHSSKVIRAHDSTTGNLLVCIGFDLVPDGAGNCPYFPAAANTFCRRCQSIFAELFSSGIEGPDLQLGRRRHSRDKSPDVIRRDSSVGGSERDPVDTLHRNYGEPCSRRRGAYGDAPGGADAVELPVGAPAVQEQVDGGTHPIETLAILENRSRDETILGRKPAECRQRVFDLLMLDGPGLVRIPSRPSFQQSLRKASDELIVASPLP